MAGWADELPARGVLARTLLDEPLALYRDDEGVAHAVYDRCPHRFAPLSMGSIDQKSLVCRYHGLAFGPDGACTRNPHGAIASAMRVRAYPVAEKHRCLWVWMGDPARADPTLLRDLSFLQEAPDTAFSKGYLHGKGEYQLFVDNVMDLTHADYLHPTTLGGGMYTQTRADVREAGNQVNIAWDCKGLSPSPLAARRFPGHEVVDAWTEVEWTAPSLMVLRNGTVPVGASRQGADEVTNVHIITPETSRTCHYFFASTRNFDIDSSEVNESIRKLREEIFSTEDEPVIRAQQERIGHMDFWSLKPLLLKTDEGPVRVRRMLDKLIAEEQAEVHS